MMSAWATGTVAVALAIKIRHLQFSRTAVVACCAFLLAYVEMAVHYGNVQPLVIAWLFLSLVLSERYPARSGILFALSVTFKLWPIFFLPWFLPRGRRRVIAFFAFWMAVLWIGPVVVFGPAHYRSLLHDWYLTAGRAGTTYTEFAYFPGQSLRGILLRYFTPIVPPLATFPRINVLSLDPRTAVMAWGAISSAVYMSFVVCLLRSDKRKLWAGDGMAFVLYSLLEPYAVKSGLISLAPAALTAAGLYTLGTRKDTAGLQRTDRERRLIVLANRLFLIACAVSFAQAILQYKPLQRYLLSFGVDFWGDVLLLLAFYIWIVHTSLVKSPECGEIQTGRKRGYEFCGEQAFAANLGGARGGARGHADVNAGPSRAI